MASKTKKEIENSVKMKSKTKFQILRGFVIVLMVPFIFSCTQPEGSGGTSGIKGVLMTKYYNNDYSVLIKEEAAVDEEVFILFGEDDFVGDRVVTSATGAFEFPFLNNGDYRLYYMSEDSTTVSDDNITVIVDMTLASGKTNDMGTIYRLKTLDYNDGAGKISGVIKKINYKNSTFYPNLEVKDISWAQDEEVYLIYGDNDYYEERIRTSHDGSYEFRDLIPGSYTVFAYSEDIEGGTEDIAITRTVTITTDGEEIIVSEITIEQL